MKHLKQTIEALLFVAGAEVKLSDLKKILEVEESDILEAIKSLQAELSDRGIILTESHKSYQLATNPEVSPVIKAYLQAQLREKLTETALETLAIIAYKQPVARAEIEAIRGVNCQYVLRLLSQRGLIEKITNPNDARVLLYRTTHEFLHHLGMQSPSELPDFQELTQSIVAPELPQTPPENEPEELSE